MPPLLAVVGLEKSYGGVAAVRGVDLALAAGEVLALIGPNGAGKSSLFNMLNGQIRPDAGTVRLKGEDVTGQDPRALWRRGVARTFQITAAFSSMSVRENVQVAALLQAGGGARLWGTAPRLMREEADARLDAVGLRDQADRPAAELAYGDLKRLELAVALANDPALLLMDEPTAGMAARERHALMEFVARHARSRGIGVLFTEHDMDIVFGHADRVLVLSRGEIIAGGEPEVVRRDPQVRAVYLGQGLHAAPAREAAPC